MTQGEQLAEMCKRKPRTYMEMYATGISTAPHMRLREFERRHPEWKVVITKRYMGDGEYLTQWGLKRV